MHRRSFIGGAALGAAAALAAESPRPGENRPRWPLPALPLDRLHPGGVWDSFYYGSWQERGSGQALGDALAAERPANDRAGMARQCIHLHVGAGTARAEYEARIAGNPAEIHQALQRQSDRLLGLARLNADHVERALAAIDTWIAHGPMIGISLQDGGVPGDHPNLDPIVRRAASLNAMIIQINWFNALEKANPLAATPTTMAALAARHPDVTFISSHAGGEWEQGIRALRPHRNVWVETSGFDATSGFIEMAVRELGAERIVFGSHFPSRSAGTEFSKILSAAITDRDRELIFGANLRRLLTPILRRKELPAGNG